MSCNGSSLQESLLKSHSCDSEESSSSAQRKADVEKWAALLAAGVTQVQSCNTSGGPFLGGPPEAWRGNVESLTPPNEVARGTELSTQVQAPGEPPQASTGNASDQNRIQVRVNIGDLGELALVVERSAAGVNIQISAQDSSILEAMAAERETLTTALSSIGHSVTSLAFIAMDRLGTNLAQPRVSSSQQTRTQRNAKKGDSQMPQSNRKPRRLNVTG